MLDILIAGAVVAGGIHGFATGAIKQVASLAAIVISFVLALNLMHTVGAAIHGWIGASADIAPLVGFVAVFAFVQLAFFAGVKLVEKIIGALQLSSLNRILGGGLGAAKATLALSVAFLALGSLGFPTDDSRQSSKLYPLVSSALPKAWDYFSARTGVNSLTELFDFTTGPGEN